MRLSGLIWWLGAFVFAGLAGFLTLSLLSNTSPGLAVTGSDGNMRAVVVAAVDIPFRRSITEAELVIRELPADTVPEGAATVIDQVLGKMSTVDMFAGEPVLMQQLVTPDIVTKQVALSIPKGKIVTAVPTESKLISNRLVRPGDTIDLLATTELEVIREQGSGPMAVSIALLQNLEVHAIILPNSAIEDGLQRQEEGGVFKTTDERGQSVLLALDAQDALTIRHILDDGGLLDLAVRGPEDDSVADTVVVDQYYLAERYQIELSRGQINRTSVYAP